MTERWVPIDADDEDEPLYGVWSAKELDRLTRKTRRNTATHASDEARKNMSKSQRRRRAR